MSEISELFARDPLDLSEQDIDTIISRYRLARSQFNLGAKQAGSSKTVKSAAPAIPGLKIDLSSLGIGDKK